MTAAIDTRTGAAYRLGHRSGLDALRGIAIVLVLVNHTGLPYTGTAGTIGVTAFFVLSGFLITRLLVEEVDATGTVSLRQFWARRALRLLPAMAGYLVVTAVVAVLYGKSLMEVVWAGTYTTNIVRSMGTYVELVPHTWSLAMEEQFYIVWPLVFAGFMVARRRRGALVGLAASVFLGSLVARVWLAEGGATLQRLHNDPFLGAGVLMVGCILGLTVQHVRLTRWSSGALVASGLVALLATSPYDKSVELYTLMIPLVTLTTVGLLAALAHGEQPRWVVRLGESRTLLYLGRISYGLYLWHYTVYFVVRNEVTTLPAKPLLQIGLSLVVAALSYRVIERPALASKDRFRAAAPAGTEESA